MTLVLRAPAKINLSLRVLRRREDGFHDIETLMAPVDLCDDLHLELAAEREFTCSDPTLPADDSNLVIRALDALEKHVGRDLPLRVRLEKRIPHGAGLGGGSSDAAALLSGANALHELGLPEDELAAIAADLGSDIPFFLVGGPAWCRGRGELIEPAPTALPPGMRVLLAKPAFGVSTPQAYQKWRESREIPGIPYQAVRLAWGELINDLERPVFQKYPVLGDMKRWLAARDEVAAAAMSGSGSTMMAILEEEGEGRRPQELEDALREEFGSSLWTRLVQVQTGS